MSDTEKMVATDETTPAQVPPPPTPKTGTPRERRAELMKWLNAAHTRMTAVWKKADATKKVGAPLEIKPLAIKDDADGMKLAYVFRVGGVEELPPSKVCELLEEVHTAATRDLPDAPTHRVFSHVRTAKDGGSYFGCELEWWAE